MTDHLLPCVEELSSSILAYLSQPLSRVVLQDNREHLNFISYYVVEYPDISNSEPVLWPGDPS